MSLSTSPDRKSTAEIPPENNLEYDLLSTPWILEKVRGDEVYAQHLYAAMCNNNFMKNDVWQILKDDRWSCSWRHAGGIVADMQEKGDYIDHYCSGITAEDLSDTEFDALTHDQQLHYTQTRSFVSEGVVTTEINDDLFKLGWLVVDDIDE